ncbi:hypothetical protein LTR70_004240 [Exophiala xenobiotica]|uniref:BTB domain-containing protein n=1 Tax=Lithohypha guttulata TaxID=1690604 RepID=A0ABR0KE17_9EURO|nr:hypothetical protein LTR24_003793 [Lithohypha guttulata]KAK5320995.1 hypothetical protein LTR70_004240 [Exophiala xenobiotica]
MGDTILDLKTASENMLRNEEFTDMVVSCKGRTWWCHRSVLCPRCPFFKVACTSGFTESATWVIKLDDDDQEAVDMMLEYLYTLEKPGPLAVALPRPVSAERAYFIGDKYDLSILQSAGYSSMEVIARHLLQSWDAKNDVGKSNAISWIRMVWSWEHDGLKDIRKLCLDRLSGMSATMLDYEPFQELLDDNKKFRIEFIKAMRKRVWKDHRY